MLSRMLTKPLQEMKIQIDQITAEKQGTEMTEK